MYLDVHEEAVQSYIRPGGEVNTLLNNVAKGVKDYSTAYISAGHVRSGRLLRGLFWNRTKLDGPLTGFSRAGSSARHTLYFHDGTSEISATYMIVPKNRHAANLSSAFSGAGAEALAGWKADGKRGRRPVSYKNSVRGQKAKPFLTEGLAVSLAKQRLN